MRKMRETVTVSLSFVSGRFLIGLLQTDNVINRYYPIKAYAPTGDFEIVKMDKEDPLFWRARSTDYGGIAFSITKLASFPFDRELSKAYQEPYQ